MNLDKFFDAIYCINLDERVDRWEAAKKEFEKLEIKKVNRFSAVKDPIGWVGCRASHIKIVEEAHKNKKKNVLIFEDDVSFVDRNLIFVPKILQQLSLKKWDMFFLGASLHPGSTKLRKVSSNLLKTDFAYTTHAYAINSSIYEPILNNYHKFKQMDVFYADYIIKKYETLLANPILAVQRKSYSDIEKKEVDYAWMIDKFEQTKRLNKV